ncbi:MAG: TIGR03936 family radical SAM-associated protein [Actinobacteria bacterium]|nr:TIGR03936 family radical SAM-associated protein [Actinomycetota bacterium]
MRVRIRYTKEGRTRFVSARDLPSIWQRSLRRADLPVRYTEGYNPHAKVSFPDALPVGVASTGEYAEMCFTAPIDLGSAMSTLSATLPDGMTILTYQQVEDGAPKLARTLEATIWEAPYDLPDHATHDHAEEIAATLDRLGERLLAADGAFVTRHRPGSEPKTVDIRPAIVAVHATTGTSPVRNGLAAAGDVLRPTIRAILRNDGPSVRPTDLHDVLLAHADDGALPDPRLLRRVVQGRLVDGGLSEALSGEHVPLAPSPVAVAR